MNQFNKIIIKARLSSNPLLLLAIWLCLIIIPYIVLNYIIDYTLKGNEERLLTKSKIQLIEEVKKFQSKLSTGFYIESKLNNNIDLLSLKSRNSEQLSKSIEKQTESKIVALFYLDTSKDFFDVYIADELRDEFSLFSRYTMKNLLLSYCNITKNDKTDTRNITYFQQLLSAVGEINLQPEKSIPILSGKEKLGRMIAFLNSSKIGDGENKKIILCLFREKDIPFKEVIKNAINIDKTNNCQREIILMHSTENLTNASDTESLTNEDFYYKFQRNSNGLSILATTSDEMLLRLGTLNTYYPLNLKKLQEKTPAIKITIDNSELEHPMRSIINRLRFPTLLLILIATFGLIKIAIYGYATNIRILSRVILCVLGAVILPFSSFIVAAYYNQYFSEEYLENELQHYTRIQTAVIRKAIEAYIENKELAISKLQNEILENTKEELHQVLTKWLDDNNASIIVYNYIDNEEKVIKADSEVSLSILDKDSKDIADMGLKNFFIDVDLSDVNNFEQLSQKYGMSNGIMPSDFNTIISNIGKIYPSVQNDPSNLYSLFPIYEDQKKANKVIGSVFIKFNTYELLSDLKNHSSSLFHNLSLGKYIVRNAIIPVNNEGLLPDVDKMLLSNDFNVEDLLEKLNEIISNKSQINWITSTTINSATYLNQVNAVIVSKAEILPNYKESNLNLNIKNILFYFILMIISPSVMLCGVIVSPIKTLQNSSEKVAKGDYSEKIDWKSGDELETLCNAFNGMTEALLQKEKMTSFVSKEVINEVSSNFEQQLLPSGERIPISVLFCALKGEKELNQYSPKEVTQIISCLVDAVDEISSDFNGQVDKLIEDTIMVVFRKNNPEENIVLNACRTALAINKRLKLELPEFTINMGIASGEAVSGKIGSRNGKLDYTVIGYAVNLAARLKLLAYKAKNTGILICPNSIRQIHGACRLNFIERINVKGINNRSFPLYELLDIRDS